MKRYYRDSDGTFKESASESFLMHSTGKWDRSKTKYVKIVKSPSGKDAYLYPDDLEPGKKYGPKIGDKDKEDEKTDKFEGEDRYGMGNIDLLDRPVLKNDDGSISTVESFSVNIDGEEVLLPTISRDKDGNPIRISEDEAIEKYMKDGKHLGKFKTSEEASAYAEKLHKDQERLYSDRSDKSDTSSQYITKADLDNAKELINAYNEAPKDSKKKIKKGAVTLDEIEDTVNKAKTASEKLHDKALDTYIKGSIKKSSLSSAEDSHKIKRSIAENEKKASGNTSANDKRSTIDLLDKAGSFERKAAEEDYRNKTFKKSTTHIDLSNDIGSSNSTSATRGLFSNTSNNNKIQPENLKSKPGKTQALDTAKGSTSSTPANRPRSHDRQFLFEKKSGSTKWHVAKGEVKKGTSIGTYQRVGSKKLDDLFKKMK